jgi:hypothetical protein
MFELTAALRLSERLAALLKELKGRRH